MNSTVKVDHAPHTRAIQLEAGPNQRLELELSYGPQGRRELVLRELAWGTGVGWFVHKSIRLDSSNIDSLRKALSCLRPPQSNLKRGAEWRSLFLDLPKPAADPHGDPHTGGGEVIKGNFKG